MEESDKWQMFDKQLLIKDSLSKYMLLLIYIPIGLALVCLRLVLSLVSAFLVSLSPLLRTNLHFIHLYANLMGVYVSVDHEWPMNETTSSSNNPPRRLLLVSNHRSELDLLAVKSCMAECSFIEESTKLSSLARIILTPIWHIPQGVFENTRPTDIFSNIKNYPLVVFPEQMPTKSACLLAFDSAALSVISDDIQIQPLAIQMRRPVLPLCLNHSNRVLNTLIALFSPFNIYHVAFLQLQPNGHLCRQAIAKKLGANLSLFNHEDVKKTLLRNHNQISSTSINGNRNTRSNIGFTETSRLALQIKDILPNASYELIQQHIQQASTLDIDTVLASILDDEQLQHENNNAAIKSSSSSPTLLPETSKTGHSLQHATKSTGSLFTSKNRFKSYEERKFELLNEARRRFLIKNPL